MLLPIIRAATPIREHALGPSHFAVLFTDIVSGDRVMYAYLLAVYAQDTKGPIAVVSSEKARSRTAFLKEHRRSADEGVLDMGSHFLCAFHEGRHINFGASDKWADIDAFETEALAIVSRLGIGL